MTICCAVCGKKTSKLKKIAINQELYSKEGYLKEADYVSVCEDCLSICETCPVCRKPIPSYFIQTLISLTNPDSMFCNCPRTKQDRTDRFKREFSAWSKFCNDNNIDLTNSQYYAHNERYKSHYSESVVLEMTQEELEAYEYAKYHIPSYIMVERCSKNPNNNAVDTNIDKCNDEFVFFYLIGVVSLFCDYAINTILLFHLLNLLFVAFFLYVFIIDVPFMDSQFYAGAVFVYTLLFFFLSIASIIKKPTLFLLYCTNFLAILSHNILLPEYNLKYIFAFISLFVSAKYLHSYIYRRNLYK